jgi:hypothetical protein
MAPIVHGLEARYSQDIQFTYLDIDDPATGDLKKALGYRVQPHVFLLDAQGQVVEEWIGFTNEAQFVEAFDEVLN